MHALLGLLRLGCMLGLLLATLPPAHAATLEREIKATFLYKFVPFVEWPAGAFGQPGAPFQLCVSGDDVYGQLIEQAVVGQRVVDHPIVVRRLASAGAAGDCQILFVSGGSESAASVIDSVRGKAVLTITDTSSGGIINFVLVRDRVGFDIDMSAAVQNHLTISSKLLALAHAVRK